MRLLSVRYRAYMLDVLPNKLSITTLVTIINFMSIKISIGQVTAPLSTKAQAVAWKLAIWLNCILLRDYWIIRPLVKALFPTLHTKIPQKMHYFFLLFYFYVHNRNLKWAFIHSQLKLDDVFLWFIQWRIHFNTQKTVAILFNHSRYNQYSILLNGHKIPWFKTAKKLEVLLDK